MWRGTGRVGFHDAEGDPKRLNGTKLTLDGKRGGRGQSRMQLGNHKQARLCSVLRSESQDGDGTGGEDLSVRIRSLRHSR